MLGLSACTAGTVSRKAGFSLADDDSFGSLVELTRGGRVVILVACDSQSGQGHVCKCTDMMGLVGSMMYRTWMNDTTATCLGRVCRFRDKASILAIGTTRGLNSEMLVNEMVVEQRHVEAFEQLN